jgi:hypothetical protein
MKSTEDHSTNKGNYKTDLTLTGILTGAQGATHSHYHPPDRRHCVVQTENKKLKKIKSG